MPSKEKLVRKLCSKPCPKDFTINEYIALMRKCGCEMFQGGRGSSLGFRHTKTGRKILFDLPHPRKELTGYMIIRIIQFLSEVGEL